MTKPLTIALAAGGTGGHMFPAEALARVLLGRGHRVTLFTDARGKGFGDRLPQVVTHHLSAGAVMGGSLMRKIKGLMQIRQGRIEAEKILRAQPVDVAVGFGGYASVPAILAAARLQIPTVLHEQNAVLGRANRLLAKQARALALSFDATLRIRNRKGQIVTTVGNPVRPDIAAVGPDSYPMPQHSEEFHLLITGGSQGARIFSQVVPAAIALLPVELRARLRIVQQCRPEDLAAVTKTYQDLGVGAETASFFADMAARLRWAHLVIARAGASTVAELMAASRPAVLVPYRFAADDHQSYNAKAAELAGAALSMPEPLLSAEKLSSYLVHCMNNPQELLIGAGMARGAARPQAAESLADLVLAQVGMARREEKR